ncbi:ATP-binding protein [Treponema sp.]|uniref:ATP-binding protein n=1 Tax=Treponema sp. TaxID=166 RepID=UPI0025801A42|nr:ATP-binding protein [Treponema sp.]MBE6354934.1 hypothetical protein [Treponema sp.]
MENEELDIRPEAGILGVFSRLSYKAWYAIAEFVDNSTQSFFSNEEKLRNDNINQVHVQIKYLQNENELIIIDDAYGMEIEDFKRAVKLDSKSDHPDTRNEFGMGLKTAASWFGEIWSVESTQLNSENKYYTEVNIPLLREKKINSVKIQKDLCSKSEHGTIIHIKNLTKQISPKTHAKICTLLESMYRRDLESGKVTIEFITGNSSKPLSFKPYEPLSYKGEVWKKNIDFTFEFKKKNYKVKGFVGILKDRKSGGKGSFDSAGFALFRRNRVIVGGEGLNYKPYDIFGEAQSPISHKLYGEIDLDDFPVNQAKDGFVWDNGLEEEFIKSLEKRIDKYIEFAKKTIKERNDENVLSEETSNNTLEKVQPYAEKISAINTGHINLSSSQTKTSEQELFDEYIVESNKEEKISDSFRTYEIMMNQVQKTTFKISWKQADSTNWIDVKKDSDDLVELYININHQFFKPFSKNPDFQPIIEKFVIAFMAAEKKAKLASSDGKIPSKSIRNFLNEFLSVVGE